MNLTPLILDVGAAMFLVITLGYGIPALQERAANRKAARLRLEKRQDWNAEVVRYASQFPGFNDPRRRGATIRRAGKWLREARQDRRAG
jgi:hypothetical protein